MTKGTGRFLGRGSIVLGIERKCVSGDLIISGQLPDKGVYEVQQTSPCANPDCSYASIRARRVDMRYLTHQQKREVIGV